MPRRPSLVFATPDGEILDHPTLDMAGSSCGRLTPPEPADLIPLPPGSELFVLPERLPVGIDPDTGREVVVKENPFRPGEPARAVAAFMAPAHTAVYSAAYRTLPGAPVLPLFAYTAVGWRGGRFWVTGFRSDPDPRQDASGFDQAVIRRKTRKKIRRFPDNRLIAHLGHCALGYGCPAARNYFLGRWEAPLPSSPACNAECVGCISLQPAGCCPASQERIRFVPTPDELAQVGGPHLRDAPRPVVSFGQGCEGEPLLQAGVIGRAIGLMRRYTDRGTINMNTNGSLPEALAELARAGLDAVRLSLNSAREEYHRRYYRSAAFGLAEIEASAKAMKAAGRFVSLNYFVLPGFTDDPAEFEALCGLVERCRVDLVQLRNLNLDPEHYLRTIGFRSAGPPLGIRRWLRELRRRFPRLRTGYYNPCLDAD